MSTTSAPNAPLHRREERPAVTQFPTLSAELTKSLTSLWTRYAGQRPTHGRTEIRGNVVTYVLADAVGDFNQSLSDAQTRDPVRSAAKLTPATYRREAVAAVVRLTRQRVASFVSSHDRDTDVATEVFTLEPSLSRGSPPAGRRFGQAERRFGQAERRFGQAERRFGQASGPPPPRARARHG